MPLSTLSTATLDELVFAGRNQTYGAFDLRRHYRPTLSRALWLGVGLFLVGLSLPTLYTQFFPTESFSTNHIMVETELMKLKEPPTEELQLPVLPVDMPVVRSTTQNLTPVVVMDAPEDMPVASIDELQDATSSAETAEGTGDIDIIAPPEATAPTKTELVAEAAPAAETEFVVVEQQPEYPGGLTALRSFLGKNLQYPSPATSAGVSGKVYVSFVVAADGSLSDVAVLKGIGFGCDEEAVRVIRQMPRWKPGKQSGRPVRVRYNLPITFTLE
ncbi:MAG: TonB family protein [Bacteroidetes bacterium]|nr:TonB family protein [Fibrella sp.]